jgi:hypothetical protein
MLLSSLLDGARGSAVIDGVEELSVVDESVKEEDATEGA